MDQSQCYTHGELVHLSSNISLELSVCEADYVSPVSGIFLPTMQLTNDGQIVKQNTILGSDYLELICSLGSDSRDEDAIHVVLVGLSDCVRSGVARASHCTEESLISVIRSCFEVTRTNNPNVPESE